MIRRHRTLLRWLLAVGDATVAGMLIVGVSRLRFAAESSSIWSAIFTAPWVPAVIFILGWIATLWALGLYKHNSRLSLGAQALAMAKAFLLFTVITFAVLYALKLPEISRAYLLALLPSMALASLAPAFARPHNSAVAAAERQKRAQRCRHRFGSVCRPFRARSRNELDFRRACNRLPGQPGQPRGQRRGTIPGTHRVAAGDPASPRRRRGGAVHRPDRMVGSSRTSLPSCRAEGKIVRIPLAVGFVAGSATYVEDLAGIPLVSLLDRPGPQLGRWRPSASSTSPWPSSGLTIGLPILRCGGLAVLIW
jgi:hypothetical protein